ncbi:MAG: hypothetical protein CMJ85_03115 [Planctomycetes bacterium]|jgi:hypothetical protein|nr:hypothetical protein [Planctomycetota bacterium]MDP6425312.1 hypothetical protein [Planctomycetota bacterium]
MRTFVLACLLAAAPSLAGQCASGSVLLKNDILPDKLGGKYTFAIVPGLCEKEAAMSVFQVGGPVNVNEVGILFAHKFATNGIKMIADVEIYDGATVSAAGKWTLGPRVFRLSDHSTTVQLTTTAYNTLKLPKKVLVKSGTVVVGFRVLQTFAGGSCQFGYDANLAVDYANTCKPGINIIDAIGHGPIDPMTYRGFGPVLCPIYFRGSWVLRACVEPLVSVTWSGNATPGGFVSLKYIAPGQQGDWYFGMISGSTKVGFQTPYGKIPLDPDFLFSCFLTDCRPIWLGSIGTFNANGEAFGTLAIPNLAWLRNSNLTMYVGFFTFAIPNLTPFKSISTPSLPIIIK